MLLEPIKMVKALSRHSSHNPDTVAESFIATYKLHVPMRADQQFEHHGFDVSCL